VRRITSRNGFVDKGDRRAHESQYEWSGPDIECGSYLFHSPTFVKRDVNCGSARPTMAGGHCGDGLVPDRMWFCGVATGGGARCGNVGAAGKWGPSPAREAEDSTDRTRDFIEWKSEMSQSGGVAVTNCLETGPQRENA
jgi:hypothetical protein